MVSSALLFCSKFADTEVIKHPDFPQFGVIIVNAKNLPQFEIPLDVGGRRKRIGFLFERDVGQNSLPDPEEDNVPQTIARKISASLALERKMLSLFSIIAVIPLP